MKDVIVGAIRWDGQEEGGWYNAREEAALSPPKWQHRVPFFGEITGPTEVHFRGNSQAVMSQEIAYARRMGLDYCAFCIYPWQARQEDGQTGPLSRGFRLYLENPHRKDINFCLQLLGGGFGGGEVYKDIRPRIIGWLREPNYQTVLDGRPLIFINKPEKMLNSELIKGWADIKAIFDGIRSDAIAAGLKNPYIVAQLSTTFDAKKSELWRASMGADAVSRYAVWGGTAEGQPYAVLAEKAKKLWSEWRDAGSQVVPLAAAGWDPRPRFESGRWEAEKAGNAGYECATPAELAVQVKDAVSWVRRNPAAAPAKAVLIYAWNENSEGGWLTPTLNGDGSVNTARAEALRAVLVNE